MKTLHKIIAVATCLICLSASTGWSAESVELETGVSIKANSLTHNQADDIIVASGDVFIVWQGMTLMAMRADFNRKTQIISATGSVVLMKERDIVRGSKLTFHVTSGRGEIENSSIYVRNGSIRLAGKKIQRANENEYSVDQGSYTTCDEDVPSWKFGADRLDLTVDEYGTGKHALLYIKDVPVFYFPYILFPGRRERQSGFLYPRLGWGKDKGVEVDIPYYWAIAPNQDLTVNLDVQSKRAVAVGLDYRYLLSRDSTGSLGGYLIYDWKKDRVRGLLSQAHREVFSEDMNVRSSINMTSDRTFLYDYAERTNYYNRQADVSSVNFLKTWQHYALTANLRYTEDYYAATNKNTLQTLPEVGLDAVRQQIPATPLYFDLDSRASNYYRENGPRGQRAYAFPRLTLVTGLPGYLNVSGYGGAHLRAYNTDDIPQGSQTHGSDGTLLAEAGVRVSTSFSKVYEPDGETLKKVRHEIIPEISYSYSMHQDQSRFPLYDALDRIPHLNTIYYSITSMLGGKFSQGETSEYRDLMRLKLMQGYSMSGDRRDLSTMVDANRPLTDVMLESEMMLHPNFRLNFDARYNVYDNYISSAAPGFEFDDKRGTTAGLSYRLARNEVDYLEAHISSKILKPWTLGYATRYSFDRRDFLESVYSAEYRHQCWSILAVYRDRPSSQTFTVSFSLMGTFGMGSAQPGFLGR